MEGMKPMVQLPRIVERAPSRLVVHVSPELDDALRAYAAAYAECYGAAKSVAELVPAMLASFIQGDRAFTKWRRARPASGRE